MIRYHVAEYISSTRELEHTLTTIAMIETDRLILRRIDPVHDFEEWAHTMSDADTMRFLGNEALDRADAWRNMAMVVGHWTIRGYGFFSVVERKTGKWVGRVGPWNPLGWPQPEVGWLISPKHRRRGYAVEAARAAIDFAFQTLGWQQVAHVIIAGNLASIEVAKSLGSTLLGEQQGLPGVTDSKVLIYGQDAP